VATRHSISNFQLSALGSTQWNSLPELRSYFWRKLLLRDSNVESDFQVALAAFNSRTECATGGGGKGAGRKESRESRMNSASDSFDISQSINSNLRSSNVHAIYYRLAILFGSLWGIVRKAKRTNSPGSMRDLWL
jgi:hypothetical protein